MSDDWKFEVEIKYCVPWSYHGTAVWMAGEFFVETGGDVATRLTPGKAGILQVFANGDKIFDKSDEDGKYPDLPKVKELRSVIRNKLQSIK